MQNPTPLYGRTLFGHPVGLFVLFLTEMWERFSFYGMRALLLLYMVDHLILKVQSGAGEVYGFGALQRALETMSGSPLAVQPLASKIYGLYTALVYLTPVFGGLLADRFLGARRSIVIGALLMAFGHFLMASEPLFLVALFFIIIGNGCFKPNISTQVGDLYAEGDPRRDRAFSIFYMGINLGGMLSPILCGILGQRLGWHYGFGAAGVGMLLGLLVYLYGQRFLPPEQRSRTEHARVEHAPLNPTEWKAIGGLLVLCLLNIVFWMVYEQQGNTMQLFADRNVDWHVLGWEMPSTWFQSLNSIFVLIFTVPLTLFWSWQARRGREPSSVGKMGIGCVVLGASFLILMYATRGIVADQRISLLWLVGCTLVYTIGELYLSPVGLSLVTKVAPPKVMGIMMGAWFLSSFFGDYLSGEIGALYETMTRESFFLLLAVLGILAGVSFFALKRPVERAIGHQV